LITSVWQLVSQPQPLLTPNDVRDKTFTTHRFREGYDMDEVDAFLDQVRVTIETIGKAKLKEMQQ
jgi:DivIVA domain-containing protein